MWKSGLSCLAPLGVCLSVPAVANDEPSARGFEVSGDYTADAILISDKGAKDQAYGLDNLNLQVDVDLGRVAGWQGAQVHVHFLNNLGGMPNNRAGTLQGVDNIEVATQRFRVFEAWIEQSIGPRTTLRAGLYDLNSEFYANDAAGLLLAPAFGVGSEISATGPNGPSIFPSSALAARVEHRFGRDGFMRVGVLNANARTLGDPGGVDFDFDEGLLLIAETGVEASFKATAGVWTYTRDQDEVVTPSGDGPLRRSAAQGAYAIFEHPIANRDQDNEVTGFVRVGVSDGHTTVFRGGWQAGVLFEAPFPGRPLGALSIGANQAFVSHAYRDALAATGIPPASAETQLEVTYTDVIFGRIGIQPDMQIIVDAGGERNRPLVIVSGLRFTFEF